MKIPQFETFYDDVYFQLHDFNNGFEVREKSRTYYDTQQFRYDWMLNKDLDWEIKLSRLLDEVSDSIVKVESHIQSQYKEVNSKDFHEYETYDPFLDQGPYPINIKCYGGKIYETHKFEQIQELTKNSYDLEWLSKIRNNLHEEIIFYRDNIDSPLFKEYKKKNVKIPFNGGQNALIAFFYLLAENHIFHVNTTGKSLRDRFKNELSSGEIDKLEHKLIDKKDMLEILLQNFQLVYPNNDRLVITNADYGLSVNKFYKRILLEMSKNEAVHLKEIFEQLSFRLGEIIEAKNQGKKKLNS